MKTVLILFAAVFGACTARAQSTLLSAEAQATRQFQGAGMQHYEWASLAHMGAHNTGVFAFASYEPGLISLALGPLVSTTPGNWYIEAALGPGIDIARGLTNLSANAYVYLESRSGHDHQKRKIMAYTNPYYSSAYGFFQMTSVMYGVSDTFSLGLYSQTEAVTGVRAQYTFKSFNVSTTLGPKGAMLGLGMDLEL